MKIKGIKYVAPIFDNSGYAKASRGNVIALHKLGIPLTLSPISFEKARPDLGADGEILNELVNKDIDYNVVLINTTPEFWSKHKEPDKINVGFTYWETSKLHPDWLGYINNNVQKVLVGCSWNKDVFKESGVEIPIGVVPCGIDIEVFNGIEPFHISGVDKDAYVFYDIFQWNERKNPLALIKAYWHEFKKEDNVALVLKTYRSSYEESEKNAIRTTIKRLKMVSPADYYPPIYLIPNMLSEAEILGLHARGDCYVSLDRGEGFGLSHFTSSSIGNPLVTTGFGGIREYARNDSSYMIDYHLSPVYGMPFSPWYRLDQLWAETSVTHGAELMRHVYENQDEAKARGQKLKKYIAENFTWEIIGKKIIEEIKEL